MLEDTSEVNQRNYLFASESSRGVENQAYHLADWDLVNKSLRTLMLSLRLRLLSHLLFMSMNIFGATNDRCGGAQSSSINILALIIEDA